MLKKRVAATVVVKNGIVVQSINFKKFLPIGKPHISVDFLNQWGVDEIILLDISASKNNFSPDLEMIKKVAANCFVPLTIGGGIKDLTIIKELMNSGADKIALNQSAINTPELITKAAHVYGDQCVVVAIDAIETADGYRVYDYIKKIPLNETPAQFSAKAQELGAGEIFLNSVDRDGSYLGFDLKLLNSVCENVSIPVIASGGARNASDFIDVFSKTNVSAASAANFFHFSEHSVNITKANILSHIPLRLETHANYSEAVFDNRFRLLKKEDRLLEEMLFQRIEKEII